MVGNHQLWIFCGHQRAEIWPTWSKIFNFWKLSQPVYTWRLGHQVTSIPDNGKNHRLRPFFGHQKAKNCQRGQISTNFWRLHYGDVIMGAIASQITSLTIVYSTVYSDADQIKHQSSASLAFLWGIHGGPVNSPHKWPVTRKMFPFDDVIMLPIISAYTKYEVDWVYSR